jgi:transposase-like protein
MKQKKIIQKRQKDFSEAEKHAIIQELIETQCTKAEIWEKYTGQAEEHGQLLRWMKQLGYNTGIKTRRPNIVTQLHVMPKKQTQPKTTLDSTSKRDKMDFEKLQLKKRVKELEAQLQDAEMKAIAFSTMVDIAEKEFKIPIRKKFNTKP